MKLKIGFIRSGRQFRRRSSLGSFHILPTQEPNVLPPFHPVLLSFLHQTRKTLEDALVLFPAFKKNSLVRSKEC